MKKIAGLILGLGILASAGYVQADGGTQYFYDGQWHVYNEQPVTIYINGQVAAGDMPPVILNDSTLVPARTVFEKLGAEVTWDESKSQVVVMMEDTNLVLTINDKKAVVNGKESEMTIPPKVINDRTMIPVRFVAENLGMKVEWKEKERIVSIDRQDTNIKNIQASSVGSTLRVTIDADYPIKEYSAFEIKDNPRVVIDIKDSLLKYKEGDLTINNAFINKIRMGQNSVTPNITRIVADVKEWTGYKISLSPDKKQMYVDFDCSPAEISAVKLSKEDQSDSIDIDVAYLRSPALYSTGDGQRFFLDVPMSVLKGVSKNIKASGNYVKSIETIQANENSAQLVINVSQPCIAQLEQAEKGIKLILSPLSSKSITYTLDSEPRLTISSPKSGINYFNYTSRMDNGRYILTLPAIVMGSDMAKLFINDGYINDISMVPSNGGSSLDLVFETKQPLEFTVDSVSNRDCIVVTGVSNKDTASIPSGIDQKIKEKIVVIDPGHGGDEWGAVYKNEAGDAVVKEKDLNLDISLALYELFKKAGIKVYLTRTDDQNMGLYERADMANNLDASLFISVHNNAGNVGQKGTMTLFYPSVYDKSYGITGERVAQIAQEEMVKMLGTSDLGVWKRPKLAVLNGTKMPAILAEVAYVSNDLDRQMLQTSMFRNAAAQALYSAAIKALNEMEAADKIQKPVEEEKAVSGPITIDDLRPRNANGFSLPSKNEAKSDYQWSDGSNSYWSDLTIQLDYAKEVNKKYTLEDQRKEAEKVLLSKLDADTVANIMEAASWQKDFTSYIWEDEIEGSGYTIWVRCLKNTGICTIDVIKK